VIISVALDVAWFKNKMLKNEMLQYFYFNFFCEQVEIVPMPYVTETTQLHLILPVTEEDKEGVGTFLDAYSHTCLDAQENTELLVIFVYTRIPLPGQEDTFSVLK
jgi:hypothetical protein